MRAILPLAFSLLALPALAQDGTGARIAPSRPEPAYRLAPATPAGAPAMGIEDPGTLIRMAESALGARRFGEAADLLERAESRLLTRSEYASEADRPAVGGVSGDLAAARDAIGRRDQAGASRLVASALQRLEAGGAPAIAAVPVPDRSGASARPTEVWGGGGPAVQGGTPLSLPGIAPQNMPVGGTASPPVPVGGGTPMEGPETMKAPPLPGSIPPSSSKPPPM